MTSKNAARALTALSLVALFAQGCASARMADSESDRRFRSGDYQGAIQSLEEGVAKQGDNGRDLLIYLLDLGLTLHTAGRYQESNRVFSRADEIAEIKDYTSLSQEAATLLTSDQLKDYKGEDFEKVLINVYQSMNYVMMGDTDAALVEARKVNTKLYRMITEGERKYKQNAFARYLSAMLFETQGEWNDAYIDYKFAWKLMPGDPSIARDLWRTALRLRMRDEMDKWAEEAHLSAEDLATERQRVGAKDQGEVIVLFENGISPIKKPHPDFGQVPKFYPRFNPVREARVVVEHDGSKSAEVTTRVFHDIEATAIANLDEKWAGVIAKKLAGIVAKEVVAAQIGKRTDPLVGEIARMAFYLSDQADCRSWNLLPRDLQIARVWVPAGKSLVRFQPDGGAPEQSVEIDLPAGKKRFLVFRTVPSS